VVLQILIFHRRVQVGKCASDRDLAVCLSS
jgi:hypothetical protein